VARERNDGQPRTIQVKRLKTVSAIALVGILATVLCGCCVFSAPGYRGPKTVHFDGERFHNQDGVSGPGFGDAIKWITTGSSPGPWSDYVNAPPGPAPLPFVEKGRMRVTFVNHATMLVQLDGVNILTDPIWSERASPMTWIGPKRVRPPGIRFEDLPEIHAVVVSHNHYDHMDVETLKRLHDRFKPKFLVGLGNAQFLRREGINTAVDMDWWQATTLEGVTITAVPAQHGSNRGVCDRFKTLWTGFVFSGSEGYAYFAGDTGNGRHFAQVRTLFGPARLAILPIGAFRPESFMAPIHLSPGEAVDAHRTLDATRSVGMHYGTFKLADDGQEEPVSALLAALRPEEKERFWALDFGEGRDVPPTGADEAVSPR